MKEKQKRDLVLKTGPETNERYWSQEVKTVYKPEEKDRELAVLDIWSGKYTPEDIYKKYDITSINSVYTWIGKYVSKEKALTLEEESE